MYAPTAVEKKSSRVVTDFGSVTEFNLNWVLRSRYGSRYFY